MSHLRILVVTVAALFASTHLAFAQSFSTNTPATSIEVVSGVMDYDFTNVGKTMPIAIRASRQLTGGLSLEVGTTFARPGETFGTRTFTAPEARLLYAWRFGRVSPFVGGGGGVSATTNVLRTRWHPTLLGGGGARIDLSDRLYAIGELRIRTQGWDYAASTAEWLGGVGWRFRG